MHKKTELPNGLRIVTNNMKQRDSVSVGFWVGVGGRYENDRLKGAAHFLEHILFKGSDKFSCEQIKEKVEGVGGALNAFTASEQTCYYAKIPAVHLNQTLEVLADMVFFPKIQKKDVDKEQTVIIEEIKMYRDLPQFFVYELLDSLLWPDHPLGKSLAGTPESVAAMSNRDLKGFHKQHYTPSNIVVAVCGNVKHESVVNLLKRKLAKVKPTAVDNYEAAPVVQKQPKTLFFKKDIEQMHLALGMTGFDENHKDRFALNLLNVILGANMSSRLFVEIREKRGLAYSISSSSKHFHDTGLFLIRAGVDNQKIVETIRVILKELEKVKRNGVSTDEFKRSKDYLIGQLLIGLEDTMEHMLWVGEGVVAKNKLRSLKEVLKEFDKVKKSDLQRVARDIFKKNRYNLAIVGPVTDAQQNELNKLLGV